MAATQISTSDRQALKDFVPGIWDARHVFESLWELASRTGGIQQTERPGLKPLWELTQKGQSIINECANPAA